MRWGRNPKTYFWKNMTKHVISWDKIEIDDVMYVYKHNVSVYLIKWIHWNSFLSSGFDIYSTPTPEKWDTHKEENLSTQHKYYKSYTHANNDLKKSELESLTVNLNAKNYFYKNVFFMKCIYIFMNSTNCHIAKHSNWIIRRNEWKKLNIHFADLFFWEIECQESAFQMKAIQILCGFC